MFDFYPTLPDTILRESVHAGIGIDRRDPLDGAWVVRQVQSRSDADFQHPAVNIGEQQPPLLRYDRPIKDSVRWQIYAGLAGEPALGPAGFPHRVSAMPNPVAPITHHWIDATHITAVWDLRGAVHGLYDVKVVNPSGQAAISAPVTVPPVNEIVGTCGCATIAAPTLWP